MEIAKADRGGYHRLKMPLKPALGVRGTVARHRLGALEGGGGASPPSNASLAQGAGGHTGAVAQGAVHSVLDDDRGVRLVDGGGHCAHSRTDVEGGEGRRGMRRGHGTGAPRSRPDTDVQWDCARASRGSQGHPAREGRSPAPHTQRARDGGGGVGTRPRYSVVCLWRRLLASRHCSF